MKLANANIDGGPIRVLALQTGRVRVRAAQVEPTCRGLGRIAGPLWGGPWAEPLPTFAWLVDHPEGPILVDTGSATHLKRLPRWHPYFRRAVRFEIEPEEEVGPRLRALGLSPRELRGVVLTHLHIDDDAGLHHLAGVPSLASEREIRSAAGLRGRLLGYLPEHWPRGFDPQPLRWDGPAVGPFRRTASLTADRRVFAVETPGHTDGHVSVIVMAKGLAIVLAGDVAYTEAQMLAGLPDGVGWSETAQAATHAALRAFAAATPTLFLPTHDPQSAERLLAGRTVPLIAPASPVNTGTEALGDPGLRPAAPQAWRQ